MVLKGRWKDGSPLIAVPNYARMNRDGMPTEYLSDPEINYAPGSTTGNGKTTSAKVGETAAPGTPVIVRPRAGAGTTALRNDSPDHPEPRVLSRVWI
jgi:hypothetical protein